MNALEQKAIDTRRTLGIPVIEEDAWKYARQDKALQEALRNFPQKISNLLKKCSS